MSDCSFCGNRPRLKCAPSQDHSTNNFVTNVPLHGQVFGLPSPSKYPPFFHKKLNDKEIREGIDKHELWWFVPPWQVPRVGTEPHNTGDRSFINRSMPMHEILCMAKSNRTLNGYIGRLKFDFPRFGKRRRKKLSEKDRATQVKHPDINKMRKKKQR